VARSDVAVVEDLVGEGPLEGSAPLSIHPVVGVGTGNGVAQAEHHSHIGKVVHEAFRRPRIREVPRARFTNQLRSVDRGAA
jgi:hypothetical protein